jgi:hypothetical protein
MDVTKVIPGASLFQEESFLPDDVFTTMLALIPIVDYQPRHFACALDQVNQNTR